MGRAGRKRKAGRRRYASGRAKPKPKDVAERVRVARAQPHRREFRSNDRDSELAESLLGRLEMRGAITRGERAAGEAFAAIVGRYRAVIDGPRAVRSLTLATSGAPGDMPPEENAAPRFVCPSIGADPIEHTLRIGAQRVTVNEWPCQKTPEGCGCAQRRDRYMRAYEAIASAGGRRALLAVVRVIRGEDLAPEDSVYLKRGLRAAQQHLGLRDLDRDDYGRNAR